MDKIGRYQLLKKVGHGAMGVVYKAMDPSIERIVAVKTMSADLDTDPELRARFFREARSAGQLSHKNIVTIYDLGEEAGKAYMAMEYLDGEDVKQMITRGARVPIESKLEFMIEVLEGLSHAHQKGIFHRDIKPGNIYITKSGQVKILDFGLARMASSDVTKTGLLMGTPNYMSPEQINSTAIDQRSDIFSAGATFYEMLTGKKPFYSSSLQSTFFKILQQDPEPLEKIDPTIPPEFSPVLLKAMAKDPAARYQSAEEMVQVLERFPKMLEQRRRKARLEARKAFEKLDSFVTENAELLGGPSPECIDLRERVLLVSGRTIDDTARNQNVELGLLEVLEIRDRATRENQRLEILLQRRQEAATLLLLASSAELEGRFDKALELAEKVAPDVPESAEADAFSKRIRKIISEREKAQALDAISHLERLISENQGYLASENRLNPADLKSAMNEPVARDSGDLDATALVAPPKSDSELIRIRDRAKAEYARLLEVIAKQRESRKRRAAQLFEESQQFHGRKMFPESLNRLDELLAQDPENLEAQALRRQVTTDFEEERRSQEQSKKAAALLQTAWAQYSAQNLEGAYKSLIDALALNPNYLEAVNLLNDVKRAQELARLEEKRRNAESAATRAREALQEGNPSQARQEVERALGFDPDEPTARAALRDLVRVEESIKTLLQEGFSLLQAGDETRAGAKAEAIFELDRQSLSGNDLKKKIAQRRETREREDRERKERIARALTQALDAEAKHQLGRARELATSVLKESANAEATALLKRIEETEAREALERRAGDLLSSAEQLAKRDDFRGAVSLIQKADAAVTSLEFVKQSLEKYQQARSQQEAREKAERERKQRIASALSEARKIQSAGELEKALALVQRITAEDPGHKEARELLQAVEDAIETRRQREEMEKRARELLFQAEVLASSGKYQEALSYLQKSEPRVISLTPVKQRLEEYQKLAKAQEEAIERARRVQNHLESGKKFFSRADFAGCEREMDQVLALEPGHPGALDFRAEARAQLQRQRAAQERARQLADAIRSIEQNLKAGHLEAARQSVSRAQAIETDNPEVARLQAQIRQREAELREQQLKKQRLQKLLADAKSALEMKDPDQADTLLTEAVTLGAERSETAALKKRIDKLRRSMRRPAQRPIPLALFFAIGLAVLAVIGLAIRAMRSPAYQQQITSAQTYLQQNEFGKAIYTLQQVPSDSRLYGQAQNLLTQARTGQKKKDIDSLTAEASGLRKAGQNDKSLATIEKLLELDPSNQTARSIRDDIKAESYANATKSEQDRIVTEALAKADELLKAGNLDAAKEKIDEVVRNRPDDSAATNLKRTITRQLDASDQANSEHAKMEQAKGKAIAAKAPETAAASFTTAQRMEQTAVRQQTAREFDQAAKTFSDATRLYAESEVYAADSVALQRTQQQRSQAENARGDYDKNRTKARDGGAETRGVAAYRDGMKSASDAQTKLDRGDFNGARGDFETASQKMQQAMLDAAQPAAAQPAPAPPAPVPPISAPTAPTNTAALNTAAQAQKAEAQRAEDERAIRNLLDRYRAAYAAKSVQDLRSVFPAFRGSREEKAFAEEMKHAKTVQLQLPVTGIQLSGDIATVVAQWQLTIVFDDSPKQSSPQTAGAQFKLRKANGVWSIQSIDR